MPRPHADDRDVIIDDVEKLIGAAMTEVFLKALSFEIQQDQSLDAIAQGEPHVAGSVGFVGGISGIVYIYTTSRFARAMTSKMVGLSEDEVEGDEMINDAMGEMANMVVGVMKSKLADQGLQVSLTIPSIVRGNHFTFEQSGSAHRRVLIFKCDNHRLLVEIMAKEQK